MQKDLDEYPMAYNTKRAHQDRGINGRMPLKAFMNVFSHKDQG